MTIFKLNSTASSVALNTAYQLFGKLITMLVTVGITAIITRFYGREAFGEFNLMQTWPALVYIVVDFGLNAIAVKEVTKDFSKVSQYFSAVLYIRILFSLFFILLLGLVIKFFPYSNQLKIGIYVNLFLVLSQALFTTSNIIFQSKLKYAQSVLCNVLGYFVIIALVIVLTINHKPVTWIAFSYVLGGITSFLVSMYIIRDYGVSLVKTWDWNFIKTMMYASLPLGLMFIFSQINFKSDSILLSILHLPKSVGLSNTESVAVYGLPYKIFEVGLVVPTFIMNSLFPIFVKKHQDNKNEFKKIFFRSLLYLGILGIITSLLGITFSRTAIKLLGGAEFEKSILVLQILLAGITLYFLTQPISWLIVILNKQVYLPWIYLLSAIFNVTANLIFIPRYSFYASSVITHLSELFVLMLLILFAIKAWRENYA